MQSRGSGGWERRLLCSTDHRGYTLLSPSFMVLSTLVHRRSFVDLFSQNKGALGVSQIEELHLLGYY